MGVCSSWCFFLFFSLTFIGLAFGLHYINFQNCFWLSGMIIYE